MDRYLAHNAPVLLGDQHEIPLMERVPEARSVLALRPGQETPVEVRLRSLANADLTGHDPSSIRSTNRSNIASSQAFGSASGPVTAGLRVRDEETWPVRV